MTMRTRKKLQLDQMRLYTAISEEIGRQNPCMHFETDFTAMNPVIQAANTLVEQMERNEQLFVCNCENVHDDECELLQ